MADLSIQKDFIEGVHEIFTTLLTDGVNDGADLYLLSTKSKPNVYQEQKYKFYQTPKRLVVQARLNPTQESEDVKAIKDKAEFVVPLKSLQDKELDVSNTGLDIMRKGVLLFHGVYYRIDNILPKAYVEDVFLLYTFQCTEEKGVTELDVEEPEEETPVEPDTPPIEEGDENG